MNFGKKGNEVGKVEHWRERGRRGGREGEIERETSCSVMVVDVLT